jgi:hypothetical protein
MLRSSLSRLDPPTRVASAHVDTTTIRLLAAGVVAGPLFLAVWAAQAYSREGFDPTRHPLSLLSLGDAGWVQILNFIVTGSLYLACAVGLRRRLRPGRAARWAPILIGLNGAGLILAGVFLTDAGAGFPPGAPEGAPQYSWHGILHEVGFLLFVVPWIVACVVLARRFAAEGMRLWVALCSIAPVAFIAVSAWPDQGSFSLRLVGATAISFALVAAVATRLMRAMPGEVGARR